MVTDRTRELLFPITILVSVAVGVGIGSVFGRTGNDSHAPIGMSGSDSKLIVDAVDAVRAELVRMRERLEASSVPVAQPQRTDTRSTAAPDATAEIQKATEALVKAADSLRSAAIGSTGGSPPLVPPRTVDPGVWSELDQHDFAQNTKTYMLWNYQQVLEKFGPPDMFGRSNSDTWWLYRREHTRSITFSFTDGFLAAINKSDQ